ncbi:MAG: ATP phosphoribosyltransferase regulatory subunit [Alphaproteobacteria bacterium]|nr:MAG: ATP phosphoribosyltransferase regulatory subunit [Alphaproteobacteria bacterium]
MKDTASKALLPVGLHDTLAPNAEREAITVSTLLSCFYHYGYAQVAPPLAEFEATLLAGVGASEGPRMFRLMDPASKKMLGIRTDITTQIARIATTRLANEPRPLRLCYAGQVLRVEGGQLRREREVGQAGVELIGEASQAAEVEVISLAIEAVRAAGVDNFTIDLTMPQFVPELAAELGLDAAVADGIRQALDTKNIDALAAQDGDAGPLFKALLSAAGPADRALDALQNMSLPASAQAQVDELAAFVSALRAENPDVTLTIDPGEYRNFEYHVGLCFTLFAGNGEGELGRGGRYGVVGDGGATEPAVGFTIYVDSLMRAGVASSEADLVFVPLGADAGSAASLRVDGHRVIAGLRPCDDPTAEAQRLGCRHVYLDGQVIEIKEAQGA